MSHLRTLRRCVRRPRRLAKRPQAKCARVSVLARSHAAQQAILAVGNLRLHCALGRSGSRVAKREGDGATPIGIWHPVRIFYRADRQSRPLSSLPIKRLKPEDGWCDATMNRNYNRFVRLPYSASAENLWRSDHVYDIVVVLDHNTRPRRRHCGSAIFVHLARPDFTPTEGCIALTRRDLCLLLASISRRTRFAVHSTSRPSA